MYESRTVSILTCRIYAYLTSGYYAVSFPLIWAWGGSTYYELNSNGVCETPNDGVPEYESNADLRLNATAPGLSSATAFISFQISGANAYHQFGLPKEVGEYFPIGLALIHTTSEGVTENDASCDFTWATSEATSTVHNTIFLGVESGTTQNNTSTSGWNVIGGDGVDDGLELDYPVSATINETGSNPSYVSTGNSITGPAFGASGLAYTTTDWMPNPNYAASYTPPLHSGWSTSVVTPDGSIGPTYFTQGTYSSTNGYDVSFGLSDSWSGVSLGEILTIQSTVTVSTTITDTLVCHMNWVKDPSGDNGNPYFWIYNGYPQSADIHIWLEGWCGGTEPEQAC